MEDQIEYINAVPKADSLVMSLRSMGYTLDTAIADIIDNSIAANAKDINFRFSWNNGNPWVAITDNGLGMSRKELITAMSFGSRNPDEIRDSNDLGRFGLGMKTASFSQCRKLTVFSMKESLKSCAEWDLDNLGTDLTKPWKLALINNTEKDKNHIIHCLEEEYLHDSTSGTIVLLRDFDRLNPDHTRIRDEKIFDEQFSDCSRHLSMIFHRFLENEKGHIKRNISINNRTLEPFDPFNSSSLSVTEMPEQKIMIEGFSINVQPYLLSHPSKTSMEEYQKYSGVKGYLNNQGFYVYRNRRLIISGTWFRLHKREELTKLIRIRVDIPNSLDHLWKLDIRKSRAYPSESIRKELKQIINKIVGSGKAVYTRKGRILHSEVYNPVWQKLAKNNHIEYTINRNHPYLKGMLKNMKQENQREVLAFLRLAEQSFPADMYYRDYSENPERLLKNAHSDKEIGELLTTYVLMLAPDGKLDDEKMKIIMETDPFVFNKELTIKLLKEGELF